MSDGGGMSHREVAKHFGIPSSTQVKVWVKRYRNGEPLTMQRGKQEKRGENKENNPFIGGPRTRFDSVEEQRDYLKAQVEYLKKRYPNLHGEGKFQK